MDLIKLPVIFLIVLSLSIIKLNAQLCAPNPNLPQPNMSCHSAPLICNLQNYCSVLPHDNEFQDMAVSGCPQIFSALNNPAFFSFIATASNVNITVIFGECTMPPGAAPGIQMAILSQCPFANGYMAAVPGTCWQNCSTVQGSTTIGSNLFNIGQQYWFVVDGCSGSFCEFEIVFANGAQFPTLEAQTVDSEDLTGPSKVCQGQTFSVDLNKPMPASTYLWSNPFAGEFNSSVPSAIINVPVQTPAGTYTVCLLDAHNPCDESLSNYGYTGDACFTFEVDSIPDTELGPFNLCLDDSFSIDGRTFTPTDTGTFTTSYLLTSPRGCDSTILLTLNVIGVDDEITWVDNILIATQADAIYQWIDCGNGGIAIDGATSQSYAPEASGSYQVIIQKDECVAYSECIEVLILSDGSTFVSNPTFFYPNPANDFLHFELNSNARIMIHDIHGRVLLDNEFPSGKQSLAVSDFMRGTYFAKVYLQDKVLVQKFILQR